MKSLCVGFIRVRDGAQGWAPCMRPRCAGDKLCEAHRDSLDGAVLGLFQSIEPADGKKTKRKAALEAAKRRKLRIERAERRKAGGSGKQCEAEHSREGDECGPVAVSAGTGAG